MVVIQAFAYGLGAGLLMSILLGAIFFLLIQKSLQLGWKSSYSIAAGVVSVDFLYVFFTILFTQQINSFLMEYATILRISGAVVLIFFGAYQLFLFKPKSTNATLHKGSLFATAASINLLNPANAAWWLGLYSMPPASTYTLASKISFGAAALFSIFITEILIAYYAQYLKTWLTQRRLEQLYKTVGFVFIALGLKLLLF